MAGSTERQPVIVYKSLTIRPSLPIVMLRSFETWIEVMVSDVGRTNPLFTVRRNPRKPSPLAAPLASTQMTSYINPASDHAE